MNEIEARMYLHDNVYAPAFREKCAQLGVTFDSVEEEALAHATALRLKQASAVLNQGQLNRQQLVKRALYQRMNQTANNVLQDVPNPQRDRAIARLQQLGPALDAVNF